MIWTLATPGRAIAVSAWSLVSTLTPYAAMQSSATSVERVEDGVRGEHGGRRAVQLDQVEPVGAQVDPGPVGPGAEVFQRVVLWSLLDPAAHLGRDHNALPGVAGQEAPDDALAAPVAVDVGRVEERDSGLDRGPQHLHRVGLGHVPPVRAELPGAEPDHRNRPSRPAEYPLLHDPRSY
jgi:hypothetical protein